MAESDIGAELKIRRSTFAIRLKAELYTELAIPLNAADCNEFSRISPTFPADVVDRFVADLEVLSGARDLVRDTFAVSYDLKS